MCCLSIMTELGVSDWVTWEGGGGTANRHSGLSKRVKLRGVFVGGNSKKWACGNKVSNVVGRRRPKKVGVVKIGREKRFHRGVVVGEERNGLVSRRGNKGGGPADAFG